MKNIIRREWMRLAKQPKLIITTFLLPCALIFLCMGLFLSDVLMKEEQSIAVITESDVVRKFIDKNKPEKNILLYEQMNDELETLYDKGKVGVIIELETETRNSLIKYDSTKLSSNNVLTDTQDLLNEIALFLQDEEVYEKFMENQLDILKTDVSTILEREEAKLKLFISISVAVLIFLVGQPLANFAMDSYVGEKERGTYDSIRLSGIGIFPFILGKTIFTVSIGMIAGALQLLTILLGLWYFEGGMGVANYVDNKLMLTITVILTISISLAMLVAVLIYVSTYFEKVRDAGTYATIGTLVFTLLTQVSNVTDHAALEYLPLININQMVLKNAHGSATLLPLLVSIVLGGIVVALFTQMSVLKLRNKE